MKNIISDLKAREILDSRGNPTLEVEISLVNQHAVASVPSGASTGRHEARELRDNDPNRYQGKGVLTAVNHVNQNIKPALVGKEFDQTSLDRCLIELDGTPTKSRLGANAILGVSLAFARVASQVFQQELYQYLGDLSGTTTFHLPQPAFNIINGGKHADSGLDLQEFMLLPQDFGSIAEKIRVGAEIYQTLRNLLHQANYSIGVGDEGGFAPQLPSTEAALDFLVQAIETSGYTTDQVKIGLDAAATSFFQEGVYRLRERTETHELDADRLISWYQKLIKEYPIISLEDGLAEDDWSGFQLLMNRLGQEMMIVGDDLTVTNLERITMAVTHQSINAVLIKPNQIGTLTETLAAITLTKQQGWTPFISHRSGETTDTFIADLAVGTSSPFIKSGSLARGERIAKYNRLMQIEQLLNV